MQPQLSFCERRAALIVVAKYWTSLMPRSELRNEAAMNDRPSKAALRAAEALEAMPYPGGSDLSHQDYIEQTALIVDREMGAENERLRMATMKLAEFASWVLDRSLFVGADLCGADVQDKAVECGLLVETTYNPNVHGENDCDAEPGDPWFIFSNEFKAAIAATEK
jgi:hypothetical protein